MASSSSSTDELKNGKKENEETVDCSSSSDHLVSSVVSEEHQNSENSAALEVDADLSTSSTSRRPDPYNSWPDPNSSPYINWDPVQIDQSGYPFRDRKWICLICFKGYQQRFSTQQMMEDHIYKDHAVLQDFWARGFCRRLASCEICSKLFF